MKKVILIFGIVIILVGIGIGGYFLFKNVLKNNNTSVEESYERSLDVNSALVQNLYKMANPSDDVSLLKELYDDGLPSNQYVLAAGMMNYIRKNISMMFLKILTIVTKAFIFGMMNMEYVGLNIFRRQRCMKA